MILLFSFQKKGGAMPQLTDCEYNCLKILYKLTEIDWFIENHALEDADDENEQHCLKMLADLKHDLEKHIAAFKDHICK
jgi:hypothetical protein